MYVILHQGGAFKGAFGAPVLKGLFEEQKPDLVLGVSVGAVNGVAACAGKWDVLEDLWMGIDDKNPMDGIKGFLRPALLRGKAIFSLAPLRDKLEEHIRLDQLEVPFGCGAVSRENTEYHTFMSSRMRKNERLIDAVIASSAISALMEPVVMKLRGRNYTWCDGGHLHPVPLLPKWVENRVTKLDIVLTNPIEDDNRPRENVDGLVEAIEWALHAQGVTNQRADLARYRGLALMKDIPVRVYAPPSELGGMLETDGETIRRRWKTGEEALKNPICYGPAK